MKNRQSNENGKNRTKDSVNASKYFLLFKYAEKFDYFLIAVGIVSAAVTGCSFAITIVVFGEIIGFFVGFGRFQSCINHTLCNLVNRNNITSYQLSNFSQAVLDRNNINESISNLAIHLVIIASITFMSGSIQIFSWEFQALRQIEKMRCHFFRSLLRQDISFFDTIDVGEFISRLSGDINEIQDGIGSKASMTLMNICRSIAAIIIAFTRSWKLTLVIFSCVPFFVGSMGIAFKFATGFTKKELDAYAKAGAIVEEVITSIQTVIAFNGQKKELKRYTDNLQNARNVSLRKGLVSGVSNGFFYFVYFSSNGLSLWYGSVLVVRGELEIGEMFTVFFVMIVSAFSLSQAFANFEDFSSAAVAGIEIFKTINRKPQIDVMSKDGCKPDRFAGEITFNNVSFTYPSRPTAQVLRNVNFKAEPGQTTAFCGRSGSGKTTCLQLIERMYDPQNGSITLDGIDIRTYNVSWLRKQIGFVTQDPVLFDVTIAENIRYGGENVSDTEIMKAAKNANAYEFIMSFPEKFDTIVGHNGIKLSCGQKQRIAIARAIVRNPKIILLDEATSALDAENEAIVQAALEKASHGRTTVVAAHRLSTIKRCNKIIGFHEGNSKEEGTHKSLLEIPNGVYKNLLKNQSFPAESGPNAGTTDECYTCIQTNCESSKSINDDIVDVEASSYSFVEVLKLNIPEMSYILIGLVGAAVMGCSQPIFSVLISSIIETHADSNNNELLEENFAFYSLLFVALGAVTFLSTFFQIICFTKSGEELTLRLRAMAFHAILRHNMSFFEHSSNSAAALASRLAIDASKVKGVTGVRFGVIVQSISALVSGLTIAFVSGWELTLFMIGFVPLIAVAVKLQLSIATRFDTNKIKSYEKARKICEESLLNMRTIASLNKEELFCKNYKEAISQPFGFLLRMVLIQGLVFGFSQSLPFFVYASTVRFGAWLVARDRITFSNVFRVIFAVLIGAMSTGRNLSFAPNYCEAKMSASRLLQLLNKKVEVDSYSQNGIKPRTCRGSIAFNDVKFRYPARPEIIALKQFTVTVHSGQILALVGKSGCGKTTCLQLLERFYRPDNGSITLDDFNIDELQVLWLRSQFGLIQQEPILFNCSIADNIKYGDNDREVAMEEVVHAAKKANIHDFITELPAGYDTNVGSKGTQLSVGQKQRLAIARALIRNPKVLLLDEATSSLDAENEKIVQETLDRASEGRTCIVIAHRLSTIRNADAIAVIDQGQIVELGTHSELLCRKKYYYNLLKA